MTMVCCLFVGLLPMAVMAEDVVFTQNLPDTITADEGKELKLSVAVEGDGHTYQWYFVNEVDPKEELPVENQTSHEYSVNPVAANLSGKRIYCRVDGVISKICTITVISVPVIKQDIPASLTVNAGDTISLSAAASGENLLVRWYFKDVGEISGQTTGTLSVAAAAEMNGRGVYCHFENSAGSAETTMCYLTVNSALLPVG